MVDYEINFHKESGLWVLWKTIELDNEISLQRIFKGSKKQCKEKLKEIKEGMGDIGDGKRIKSAKS